MQISNLLRVALAIPVIGSSLAESWAQSQSLTQPVARPQPSVRLLSEFRPIGGDGNNLVHPDYNAVPGSAELIIAPLAFKPGAGNIPIDGPNARLVSNVIAGGTGARGENADSTDSNATAWLYVFGQFVDHDIDLENTANGARIDITVPPNDPVFAPGTTIAMSRDGRDPRTNTIINTTAGYLDLSQLYGSTAAVAAGLRNADGTLKSSGNGKYLPVQNDFFVTGDPRVMENPELTAVTILFMREHNRLVGMLRAQHPNWSGDQLYAMAKAITTAEYQNIVYKEYLPVLIGDALGSYRGYDPHVNANVTQEFSTAAFRVGHSQVSEDQEGLDNNGNVTFEESLAQAFFNTASQDVANGVDAQLRALGADVSQATDVYAAPVLRNLLFAPLVGGNVDQIDLIAIDIQRERDVGINTLNRTRVAMHLSPYHSFSQLTDDRVLQANFKTLYGDINNVDLFMGGLAEEHARGAAVGSTFQAIIADQFERLRSGDRFYWKNQDFDSLTAELIERTTLGAIIKRNTDTTSAQEHVFVVTEPHHIKRKLPVTPVDTHGRRGVPFIVR